MQAAGPRMLEFWFDFGSNYSYLSVMRIEAAAQAAGVHIAWRPFLLGPVFRSLGLDNSPFVLQPVKGAYMWQDMPRQCRKYGLPWKQPTTFPRRAVLPLRVALVGAEQPWIGAYCRRVMQLNFAEDQDIDTKDCVAQVLAELALPADSIIDQALSEVNKLRLREQTELAVHKGVFGAPTFFVGPDMYWGNDRLDDALSAFRLSE